MHIVRQTHGTIVYPLSRNWYIPALFTTSLTIDNQDMTKGDKIVWENTHWGASVLFPIWLK